jgi:LysR family transcriptional regulator, transcriptional activator of the cysJI operon
MNVETLKIFCDLAELLSFSKTAEKNFLSQSAVSQQLAQLELQYNCQLINRKKRPVELTKEGQILYRAFRDIIDRYELLKGELNLLKSKGQARINVAAIYSIGMHTLPDYVKKFMVKNPKINVHVEYFNPAKIYELILEGDFDVGLVAVPKKDKKLDVYDFEDEPLVLVCSPKHSLAVESEIDIHKIQFESFVAFETDVPSRIWIDGILRRYGITVRPVMEFDNVETIKRAVEINVGVSIIPRTTVVQEVLSGSLKAIPFSNENFVRPTGIIVRKDGIRSPAVRAFIDVLQKKA